MTEGFGEDQSLISLLYSLVPSPNSNQLSASR